MRTYILFIKVNKSGLHITVTTFGGGGVNKVELFFWFGARTGFYSYFPKFNPVSVQV